MEPVLLTQNIKLPLPFYGVISCGFPSPAADYAQDTLDLNQLVVKHPLSTYYMKADGMSMADEGIETGDILVIDRSLDATNGKRVVCVINGEFTLKNFKRYKGRAWLVPANKEMKAIELTEDCNAQVWGVVTFVVKKMK